MLSQQRRLHAGLLERACGSHPPTCPICASCCHCLSLASTCVNTALQPIPRPCSYDLDYALPTVTTQSPPKAVDLAQVGPMNSCSVVCTAPCPAAPQRAPQLATSVHLHLHERRVAGFACMCCTVEATAACILHRTVSCHPAPSANSNSACATAAPACTAPSGAATVTTRSRPLVRRPCQPSHTWSAIPRAFTRWEASRGWPSRCCVRLQVAACTCAELVLCPALCRHLRNSRRVRSLSMPGCSSPPAGTACALPRSHCCWLLMSLPHPCLLMMPLPHPLIRMHPIAQDTKMAAVCQMLLLPLPHPCLLMMPLPHPLI